MLARPLSRLLPVVSVPVAGAGFGWRAIWPCVLIPALATPLVLRLLPTHFLLILVADYLSLHFWLHGLLALLCLRWRRGQAARAMSRASRPKLAVAALAITLHAAATLGEAIDAHAT